MVHLDDSLLPAAPYLTGTGAAALVATVLDANDGELIELRPTQVLYRPGRDLVVSYDARVSWSGRAPVAETVCAGTTVDGPPQGAVALEADGMSVGVWRYPFDPALPGLERAVWVAPVGELLGVDPARLRLAVRAFRPSKRAVVHATWPGGEAYVKVVAPDRLAGLVERHAVLGAAGVPVPEVLATDVEHGLLAMRALHGTDMRVRLIEGSSALPSGGEIRDLVTAFASVDLGRADSRRPPLLDAAPRHAALVRSVLPEVGDELDALLSRLAVVSVVGRPMVTIHGDLHDAQIRIDDQGRIVGVLDVDDAGPGDPLDDLARVLGHMVALSLLAGSDTITILDRVERMRTEMVDPAELAQLDVRVAAALVGLATGPFRAQDDDWRQGVRRVLDAAARWSARTGQMREPSGWPHRRPIPG
ncbi:MAG: aminoglycoside phosphotransferase family protein [Acidimicrobiia bacterium]|nr:aminoglycoside phosphotransferase family protein [Acidimicrobiia bacterium]